MIKMDEWQNNKDFLTNTSSFSPHNDNKKNFFNMTRIKIQSVADGIL